MLRKALFQVHLWTGIGLGLYVVMICLTGSILVFRIEVYRYFRPGSVVAPNGERLSQAAIGEAAKRLYPDLDVTRVQIRRRPPNSAVDVYLEGPGRHLHRLFDPYTGIDLGDAEPFATRAFEWVVDLHDNLLGGRRGRVVNGVGGMGLTAMALTGLFVWWPGLRNVPRALGVRRRVGWKRFNWDLHNMLGFWSFAFVFMWAITGVYLVFPQPFQSVVDALQDRNILVDSAGDRFVAWFTSLHFGRFAGLGTKIVWGLLGLVPPVLFATGVIMWWNRLLAPRWRARQGSRLRA